MNGFIIINKPLGYTSRDIVNIVGKKLKTRKIGHTGTLDPNASGVLVLAVGKALKLCDLMMDYDKEYIAEAILGIETDTLDMDTNATILREDDVFLEESEINKAVASFKGTYLQEVPKYSSVKVNGKKLYEYARSNMPVILPKKEVKIKDMQLIDKIVYENNKIIFKIRCTVSKGTYIRSLIRDIGNKLNCPAVMKNLIRTRIGIFDISKANNIDDDFNIISITEAFNEIKKIKVDDKMAFKIKNGVLIDNLFDGDMAFILDKEDNLLALYKNIDNKCRPYKIFI